MGGPAPLARPRALRRGGAIGVCAPSSPIDPDALACGERWLADEGYRVVRSRNLDRRCGYLAGPDAARAADFLDLVRNPEVDAILLARGGYGVGRWLRELDPDEVVRTRKPIVGYSDATLLLLLLRRAGLASIHGPMLERTDLAPAARARLLALLSGDPSGQAPIGGRGLRTGAARGPLVGGSLSLVAASLGTPWEIDTSGAILFLEDVNEAPYAIDRKLVQLRDSGKLAAASGVAFGALVDCESERYPETSAPDVLREVGLPEVVGPVVTDLPIGHIGDHRAVGFGVRACLDGDDGTLTLEEPVVSGR
jgi:muramoyltetrapeptide carboxypeptidase